MAETRPVSRIDHKERLDAWENSITGLRRASRDKGAGATVTPTILDIATAENLFRGDDMARKIVERVVLDAFREGWEISADDTDAAERLTEALEAMHAPAKLERAWRDARLHGGAAIVLGLEDGQAPELPLSLNSLVSISWATVMDRWQLNSRFITLDLTDPNYGKPEAYMISSAYGAQGNLANALIHHTRVIRFDGAELPDRSFIANNYWGDSILANLYDKLQNFSSANDSAAHVMHDFAQAVFELEGLTDLLTANDRSLLEQRLALIDSMRSVVRAIVIEKGEVFRREATPLTGVPEVLDRIAQRLVAASNMPHTVLLGEGSAGNTSGRTETRDWYDYVSTQQEKVLKPRLMRFIQLVCASKQGPTGGQQLKGLALKFRPLWQPEAADTATVRKTNAEADAIYLERQVLDPSDVRKSRFGGKEYGSEITVETDDVEITPEALAANADLQTKAEPVPGAEHAITSPQSALNGAQVSSLLDILFAVASGALPRDSGLAIVQAAFALPADAAAAIFGSVGAGFEPKVTVALGGTPPVPSGPAPAPAPERPRTDASDVQCVLVDADKFGPEQAAQLVASRGYRSNDPSDEGGSYRFTQANTDLFIDGSLREMQLEPGFTLMVGRRKSLTK